MPQQPKPRRRSGQLDALAAGARPLLRRIVQRDEFTAADVVHARLVEAQLRDGIRAPGLDSALTRTSVWRARQRRATVLLLDDGALAQLPEERGESARRRLQALLAARVDTLDAGASLTARIMPPGRDVVATVVITEPARRHELLRREYRLRDLLPGVAEPREAAVD